MADNLETESGSKNKPKAKTAAEPAAKARRRRLALYIVLGLLALAVLILALTRPSGEKVVGEISQPLIDKAGSNYSQQYYNYLAFSIARGKNVRSAESDTHIGFAGRTFAVNAGAAAVAANVLCWLPALINGTRITISLTVTAVCAGVFLSVFLALGKISRRKLLSRICSGYIFFFRGTPLLMQLFFIYYGLPQISPALAINNKFLAAFVTFTLNSAAYCAEIIRAAIQSIDKGQFEASRALGMSYGQTMRLVVIPQSIRRLIPPVANEFIMVLKDASLVSIIALTDLTFQTRNISSSSASALVYVPAMIIYLIITAIFTYIFNRMEKRFSIYT